MKKKTYSTKENQRPGFSLRGKSLGQFDLPMLKTSCQKHFNLHGLKTKKKDLFFRR